MVILSLWCIFHFQSNVKKDQIILDLESDSFLSQSPHFILDKVKTSQVYWICVLSFSFLCAITYVKFVKHRSTCSFMILPAIFLYPHVGVLISTRSIPKLFNLLHYDFGQTILKTITWHRYVIMNNVFHIASVKCRNSLFWSPRHTRMPTKKVCW